jgi:microcystin-dependent protein
MAANKGYVDAQIAAVPAGSDMTPAGTVIYTARSTAPTGYLKANGAAVSRSTYATLFAAIGTVYGAGDGSTTFNLPELRGEFVRGLDDGRGIDESRTLGSAQAQSYQSHTHTATVSNAEHTHNLPSLGGSTFGGTAVSVTTTSTVNRVQAYAGMAVSTVAADVSVSNASSGAAETRPRNVALLACIRT